MLVKNRRKSLWIMLDLRMGFTITHTLQMAGNETLHYPPLGADSSRVSHIFSSCGMKVLSISRTSHTSTKNGIDSA